MGLTLVTGGSGYVGSAVVRALHSRGERVRVLDVADADDRPPEVEFARADIRDLDAVRRAARGVEVVHHNVAMVPVAKDAAAFRTVNVDGSRHLFQAAFEAGVRKVVHVSSSAVFGVPPRNPVDDSVEPAPREAYGRAKLEAERLAAGFAGKGLDVTVVRPRTVLGAGRLGIFSILFDLVQSGGRVPVLGRGDNRYQFVHADDLVDACLRAARRPGPAVYNVGADRFGTMRELLEALIRHAGTGARLLELPFGPTVAAMRLTSAVGLSPLGPYHALMYGRELFFDLSKAKRELGWSPRWSNEEMALEAYDWYVANRDKLSEAAGGAHRRPLRQGVLAALKWL